MMRSEAEIRTEVETRLRRRGLLILNGGMWAAVVFFLFEYTRSRSLGLGEPWTTMLILFLLAWLAVIGVQTIRVLYVEMREWLVRYAIERERELYMERGAYEKRKHDQALSRRSDDGELVAFPLWDVEDKDAQRSPNS